MFIDAKQRRYKTESRRMLRELVSRGYEVHHHYRRVDDNNTYPLDRDDITFYRNERGREVILRKLPGGRCELYTRIPADRRGVFPDGHSSFFKDMLDALDMLDKE